MSISNSHLRLRSVPSTLSDTWIFSKGAPQLFSSAGPIQFTWNSFLIRSTKITQLSIQLAMQLSESIVLNSQSVSIEAKFHSPIKQITQYLYRFESYKFKTALTSINLKDSEFLTFYSDFCNRFNHIYQSYRAKTVDIIEDLIMTAEFTRILIIRSYTTLVQTFQRFLLRKDCDPYNFNPQQFEKDFSKVKDYLQKYKNLGQPTQVQKIKIQISLLTAKLMRIQKQKVDQYNNCKVIQPFLAQNCEGETLETGTLFKGFYEIIRRGDEKIDEGFSRKHFKIYESIVSFGNVVAQHIAHIERKSRAIIRDYDCTLKENKNPEESISVNYYVKNSRQIIDANDMYFTDDRIKQPPALMNRKQKVKFKGTVRIFDPNINDDYVMQMTDNPEKQDQNADQMVRLVYQRIQQRQRQRQKQQLELQIGKRRLNPSNTKPNKKAFVNRTCYQKHRQVGQVNWTEIAQEQGVFSYWLKKAQETDWNKKQNKKETNADRHSYAFAKKQYKSKVEDFERSGQMEGQMLVKLEEHRIQLNTSFEQKKRQEFRRRRFKLESQIREKSYESFAKATGKMSLQTMASASKIKRYGFTIDRKIEQNQIGDLTKFFFFYFKERYFRQNKGVQKNSHNPVLFIDLPIDDLLTAKNIQKLTNLTRDFKEYYMWSRDIVYFQLQKSPTSQYVSYTVYCYEPVSNAQKLLHQLRRFIDASFKEKIVLTYYDEAMFNHNPFSKFYSKLENFHRMVYGRHKQTVDLAESMAKGKEIAQQILLDLLEQISQSGHYKNE